MLVLSAWSKDNQRLFVVCFWLYSVVEWEIFCGQVDMKRKTPRGTQVSEVQAMVLAWRTPCCNALVGRLVEVSQGIVTVVKERPVCIRSNSFEPLSQPELSSDRPPPAKQKERHWLRGGRTKVLRPRLENSFTKDSVFTDLFAPSTPLITPSKLFNQVWTHNLIPQQRSTFTLLGPATGGRPFGLSLYATEVVPKEPHRLKS